MEEITLHLDSVVLLFYEKLAFSVQKQTEEVIADALFMLAGELSLEALQFHESE